jgi:hypothetical protein
MALWDSRGLSIGYGLGDDVDVGVFDELGDGEGYLGYYFV